MNLLHGVIAEIVTKGGLSLVKATAAGCPVTAIVVDTPETATYLVAGNPVQLLFKENEVAIAKAFSGYISLQNKFQGIVSTIETGKLLCRVEIVLDGNTIQALITRQAADQMYLAIGDPVTAMVKTNEISLAPYD